MDMILWAGCCLWAYAHLSDESRYSGWFKLPSLTRPLSDSAYGTEFVLLVRPQQDVTERAFFQSLESACPAVASMLATLPEDLVHGQTIRDPPDLKQEVRRLVQETGLSRVADEYRIGVFVGSVEAQSCEMASFR